jgi:acetylornithine deacetylase
VAARGITWLDLTVRAPAVHAGLARGTPNPVDKLADVVAALRGVDLPTQEGLPPAALTPIRVDTVVTPPRTAHSVTLRLDRRTLPSETPEGVRAEIDRVLARLRAADPTLDADVVVVDSMAPFRADAGSDVVSSFVNAGRELTGHEPALAAVPHGTCAGMLADLGVPSVMFGPARIEDRNDEEHVSLAALVDATRIFAAVGAGLIG